MRIVLPLIVTALLGSFSIAAAQESDAYHASYAPDSDACSREFFEAAEARFAKRAFSSQTLAGAEQRLKKITVYCGDVPWISRPARTSERQQEERANTGLSIGFFYLERFRQGKTGTIEGARSRLSMIVEQYPEFSKMDQVLARLGDANVLAGRLDEAVSCYRRIVKEFPRSQYFCEAALQLDTLDGEQQSPF
jgi:hypothetical protein